MRDAHLGVIRRGPDFTKALHQAIDTARRYGCQAILNGGDILNAAKPSSQNIADLMEIDAKLVAAKLPMFVISGNHDKSSPPWLEAIVPHRLTPFPDCANVPIGAVTGLIPADNLTLVHDNLTFHCLPFLLKESLAAELAILSPKDVVLWHGSVQELMGFPDPDAAAYADLQLHKWRAFLMGDIHTRNYEDVPNGNGTTTLVGYCGATELVLRNDPLNYSVEIVDIPYDRSLPVRHFPVEIKTRTALAYQVNSEPQLQEVLAKISTKAHEHPIVFVRYNRDVENARTRLLAAIDSNRGIMRAEPMSAMSFGGLSALDLKNAEAARPLPEFAGSFFPGNLRLAELGARLCSADLNPSVELSLYVDTRLQEILNAHQ